MELIRDMEARAREGLSEQAWAYLAGGAADEITLRASEAAWRKLTLRQRVLRDVSRLDTSIDLLGSTLSHPILLAPTGYHRLFHTDGELATARGAASSGALYVVSSFSTTSIEDIARAAPKGRRWFQLYIQRDRGFTLDLVRRAEAAGCTAIVLTVDTPVIGVRDREQRAGFSLPNGVERVHLHGLEGVDAAGAHRPSAGSIYGDTHDPATTWRDLEWLVRESRLPVIAKGVTDPEDALRATDCGCQAIIVSNHGARNLDTMHTTAGALPDVTRALADSVPVLVDGGIRRGTDVLKARALGASAVLIGRPYLWGLAIDGADGVAKVVHALSQELQMAMALTGVTSWRDVDRSALVTNA